jgi:hypothetical protein
LNNNIKCGNSLIDDPEVAGEKAFNWQNEFPQVFEKGGFEVVIGNPPYVRQELLGMDVKKTYMSEFPNVGNGTADLYVYFYELGLRLLRDGGMLSYITPNKWFKTKYGKELRKYIVEYSIIEIVDFFENRIFEDASTEPQIITIVNSHSKESFQYQAIEDKNHFFEKVNSIEIIKEDLNPNEWFFLYGEEKSLLKKLYVNSISLMEYTSNGVKRGVLTGLNKAFIFDNKLKDKIIKSDPTCENLIVPYANATDIKAWHLENTGKYFFLNTGFNIEISEKSYRGAWEHLNNYYQDLEKRQDKGKSPYNLRACDYYELFAFPKIIFIHTAVNHHFHYDTNGVFVNNNSYIIVNSDRVICAILNSNVFNYLKIHLFPAFGNAKGRGRSRLNHEKMARIPIPINIRDNTRNEIEETVKQQQLNSKLNCNKTEFFLKYLRSKLFIESISNKLKNWHELEFSDFIKELNKAVKKSGGAKLSKSNEMEWMELFESKKAQVEELKEQINQTDKEIDKMVYELYELTPEEIEIVENSVK